MPNSSTDCTVKKRDVFLALPCMDPLLHPFLRQVSKTQIREKEERQTWTVEVSKIVVHTEGYVSECSDLEIDIPREKTSIPLQKTQSKVAKNSPEASVVICCKQHSQVPTPS